MGLGSMDGLVSVPTWFRYTVTTWFKLSVAVAEGTSYSYRPGILPAQTSCVKVPGETDSRHGAAPRQTATRHEKGRCVGKIPERDGVRLGRRRSQSTLPD